MYRISAHAKPTKNSTEYGRSIGAYTVAFIDYKEIDGAFELVRYYIESDDWIVDNIDEDCFLLNSKEDVEEDKMKYYEQALTDEFSLVFYCYDSTEKEDEQKKKIK